MTSEPTELTITVFADLSIEATLITGGEYSTDSYPPQPDRDSVLSIIKRIEKETGLQSTIHEENTCPNTEAK